MSKKEAQFMFEIFLPSDFVQQFGVNDKEADVLYRLWKESAPGAKHFASKRDDNASIISLKAKGYVVGHGQDLQFTEKGKKVIVEMVVNEPNAFEKNSKSVSYSSIKAKTAANKRERQAFTKKQAGKKAPVEPFNLRKESLKRMRDAK